MRWPSPGRAGRPSRCHGLAEPGRPAAARPTAMPVHGTQRYLRTLVTLDLAGTPIRHRGSPRWTELARDTCQPDTGLLGLRPGRRHGGGPARADRRGVRGLDEAMLPGPGGTGRPLWAGDIYCTTIHLCEELSDLARMRQWTESLARWSRPLSETFMYAQVTRAPGPGRRRGRLGVIEETGPAATAWSGPRLAVRVPHEPAYGDCGRRGGCAGGVPPGRRSASTRSRGGAAAVGRRDAGALSALRVSLAGHGRLARARLLLTAVELAWRPETEGGGRGCRAVREPPTTTAHPAWRARAAQAALALADGRPGARRPRADRAAAIYRDQRYRYAGAVVTSSWPSSPRPGRTTWPYEATAIAIYTRLGARADLDRLRRDPAGRADRSRGRGAGLRNIRGQQPGGRRTPGHQREDGEPAPRQHLHQGRRHHRDGRGGLGPRARAPSARRTPQHLHHPRSRTLRHLRDAAPGTGPGIVMRVSSMTTTQETPRPPRSDDQAIERLTQVLNDGPIAPRQHRPSGRPGRLRRAATGHQRASRMRPA